MVTIDTPHQGAFLLNNGQGAIDGGLVYLFNNFLGDVWNQDSVGCQLGYVAGSAAISGLVNYGFSSAAPATADLGYLSPYTSNLNQASETFPRVGITGRTNQRWLIFRLVGDLLCDPESSCGGRAFATYVNALSYTYVSEVAIDLVLADYNYAMGNDQDAQDYEFAAQALFSVVKDLDNIDDFWVGLVNTDPISGQRDSSSDGIVQAGSQTYPGASAANFIIGGADTHVGATKSPLVRAALDSISSTQLFVPKLACSFSVSYIDSPTSVAALGNRLFYTVNNPGSCPLVRFHRFSSNRLIPTIPIRAT